MNGYFKALAVGAVGLLLGLLISRYVLAHASPFDRVALGAWRLEAHAGSMQADPFTRARMARTGEIPLAVGEGLRWVARTDDAGRRLDGRCTYAIGPEAPQARYWTLSVVDANGFPIANPAERYGFRSSEILRRGDGDFTIMVSAAPQPGNWLPIEATGRFALALRLYDAPLAATPAAIDPISVPRVTRVGCR